MTEDSELLEKYNYPDFTPEYYQPWMRFDESPKLGEVTDDFALTDLDGGHVGLRDLLKESPYTILEFGSFT